MSAAAQGRGGVGIRLYTEGGDVVRRTFDQVGDSGKKMWAEIAMGERSANPAIRALNTGANQAKAGIGGLANMSGGAASGLSAFGVAGVAAAAALGAVAMAGASLKQSLTWAAELTDVADQTGVTTEALQGLRYAADETGVPIEALEGALQKLNGALGAMLTGVGDGKIKEAFAALKISREDLVGMQNASDLLPLIADRISEIDNQASRVQILKKIGLDGLEPLLRDGADGLRGFAEEAKRLGITVDGDVVGAFDEMERSLERNQQQIDGNVRKMQASLAPFFLWLSNMTTKAVTGLVNLLSMSESERMQAAINTRARIERGQRANGRPLDARTRGIYDNAGRDAQAIIDARARRAQAAIPPTVVEDESVGGSAPGGRGGGQTRGRDDQRARDREEEQRKRDAARAAEDLDREELRARREGLRLLYAGDSAEDRARLAEEMAKLDRDERDASRLALRAEIMKGGATQEAADAQMAQLRELDAQADALAEQSRQMALRKAWGERQVRADQVRTEDALALLSIQGEMAKTDEERYQIGRQILAAEHALERRLAEAAMKADGMITKEERDHYDALVSRQNAEVVAGAMAHETDLRATFRDAGREVVQAIEDGRLGELIGDKIKSRLIDGALDNLFSSLSSIKAPASGGWMSQAFNFLSSTFLRRAGGGYVSGPGGPTEDRIPAMLSNGEYVINAAATERLRPLLDQINGGGWRAFARGGLVGTPEVGREERML